MNTRRGLTLVETMIVAAIIGALAAITIPVIANAKVSSRRATTISNLHQCASALILYSNDADDTLPLLSGAEYALSHAPTCDSMDPWRSTCNASNGAPFVGSYAYIRGTAYYSDERTWNSVSERRSNIPLLLFLGYSDPQIPKFSGNAPSHTACNGSPCAFPTSILRVRRDGSVEKRRHTDGTLLFSWTSAFGEDPEEYVIVK